MRLHPLLGNAKLPKLPEGTTVLRQESPPVTVTPEAARAFLLATRPQVYVKRGDDGASTDVQDASITRSIEDLHRAAFDLLGGYDSAVPFGVQLDSARVACQRAVRTGEATVWHRPSDAAPIRLIPESKARIGLKGERLPERAKNWTVLVGSEERKFPTHYAAQQWAWGRLLAAGEGVAVIQDGAGGYTTTTLDEATARGGKVNHGEAEHRTRTTRVDALWQRVSNTKVTFSKG